MTTLRSWLFQAGFVLLTAVVTLLYLPLLAGPRRWVVAAGRLWCRAALGWLALAVGLRWRLRGRENLPDSPAIVALKHQSAWDTIVLPLVLRDPAVVHKRNLRWIPLFGWLLAGHGMIPIDRRARAVALRGMMRAARREAGRGRPIAIFPEGTRALPGEARPYLPGVAALYRDLGLPVVPVALDSGLFWPRYGWMKRPGVITLSVLPAIPPGLSRSEFMTRLAAAIEGETARLLAAHHAPKETKSEHFA